MRRRGIPAMLLAVALALPAAGGAQTPPRAPQREAPVGEARLEPGDLIRITVWRKPELSGEFTIDAHGAPRHPLYKKVPVVGMPLAEAERRLVQFLTEYEQNPQVVIEPLFRVTIGGEVMTPNLFTLARETTVLQAIALAGGPTERGRLNKVRIIRGNEEIEADLTKADSEWARRRINSGDQILVSRKRNFLTEVVAPFAAIVGAVAALVNITRK
jgi:polysaccharide export outer membrane protein